MNPAILTMLSVVADLVINIGDKAIANKNKKHELNHELQRGMIDGSISAFSGIVDSAKECKSISQSASVDIKKLEEQSKILIEKIETDKEVFLKVLEYTFHERSNLINKSFECIDKAIETNNVELMNQAFGMLHHISEKDIFGTDSMKKAKQSLDDKDFPMLEI